VIFKHYNVKEVRLFLFLIKEREMKLYGGAETYIMALDRCEWLASCPGRFTSREKAHDTYWTGD
jgi:hypothetical protein